MMEEPRVQGQEGQITWKPAKNKRVGMKERKVERDREKEGGRERMCYFTKARFLVILPTYSLI